jgi:hypothetical protein
MAMASLMMTATPVRGQVSMLIMGGDAYNFPTPLTVHQYGYPDIKLTARYDTRPFKPQTPYYAWRASLWNGDGGWELGQIHHRVFLANPPPSIQFFAIHYGYDYYFLGYGWKRGGFVYHLGMGPIVTSPQTIIRDMVRPEAGTGILDAGYYFSGIGAQAAVEKDVHISRHVFLAFEVALTVGDAWWVPVADGHADVPNVALHGQIGVGFDL